MLHKCALVVLLLITLGLGSATGQIHPETEEPDTVQINNVSEIFTKGKVGGHFRNYFMSTWNHRALSDHYANAIGAEISYKTAAYHGFKLGIAGLFTYNVFSSDISKQDPIAGSHPKLEPELFDIKNPENKADLDRLDELFLEYKSGRFLARIGRFSFNSPLINPQDTRMKPYTVQGISFNLPISHQGHLTFAWFDHFSPRSTVEWFTADATIGLYSPGVDVNGNPSGYKHQVKTRGVAVAGVEIKSSKRLKTEAWNYWIDNISNNSYGRAILEVTPRIKAGVEGLYQFRLGTGGNTETSLSYFPQQQQWLAGGMVSYEPVGWNLSLNFLHLGKKGRFLFPREWGREQFFATLPRGRLEGTGDADIVVVKFKKHWSERVTAEAAVAKSWLPSPENFIHNKYGAVSAVNWVTDIHYTPANPVLQGLGFRLLYVGRASPGTQIPLADMYYNTNFHNLNFITQLTF